MASAKEMTARETVRQVQALTGIMDIGPDVWQQYWDVTNSFGVYQDDVEGQAVDPDLIAIGMTKAQLVSCVTLLENLKKFFGNEAVATNTYRITVNDVRHLAA